MTREEEDDHREAYGEHVEGRFDETRITKKWKIVQYSRIEDLVGPNAFLDHEYDGHCQICNSKLEVGQRQRPMYFLYRIVEFRGENKSANLEFNVLCLCPNCWVLEKYAGGPLKSIEEIALKRVRDEVDTEWVQERGGEFYVVEIKLAGGDAHLYFTREHMARIAGYFKKGESLELEDKKEASSSKPNQDLSHELMAPNSEENDETAKSQRSPGLTDAQQSSIYCPICKHRLIREKQFLLRVHKKPNRCSRFWMPEDPIEKCRNCMHSEFEEAEEEIFRCPANNDHLYFLSPNRGRFYKKTIGK